MPQSPLKIALVGCGQIADAHLQEIRHLDCAQTVAVCDAQPDLARQAAARFNVPREFSDLGQMLREIHPDVVHITTPPHTHAPLACQALDSGCHVYVEKPFTATVAECDQILQAARRNNRLVSVGHDQLFDPAWLRCRQMVDNPRFGEVTHVESIQGYDLSGSFGRMFALDPTHWLHRLPGGLFQNVMSHALYRITDVLPGDLRIVHAHWFSAGGASGGFPSELRAIFMCGSATASLNFTSAARPTQRVTRIYGTRQSVEVDLDAQVVRTLNSPRLPGAFGKIEAPWRLARQAAGALGHNVARFLRSDLQFFGGMRRLFERFYQAILADEESPISAAETRRVTLLMDDVFKACQANHASDYRVLSDVASRGSLAQLVRSEQAS